ncbi:hypothetical protein TRFO_39152 [Tritrichomonas foetus]|uniref:Protein kinase domain-containing protein n=1 Tax=Tritrichomonas foetus TaxID=1144522 RepID=A0A1J4J628_9EUKA|nr:hypothetical protein TRFO_39152 [Tritrichomonas foetus]|eukprot:OHS94682.1 hypothetical protein TRFO_39152 [Tritrichomonas foetus]
MQLTFCQPHGNSYTLEVDPNSTVLQVKQQLQTEHGLPADRITIIKETKILKNDEVISRMNIRKGTRLIIYISSQKQPMLAPNPPIKSDNQILKEENKNLKNTILKYESTIHELVGEIEEFSQNQDSFIKTIKKLETKNKKYEYEIKEITKSKISEIEDLQKQICDLNNQIIKLNHLKSENPTQISSDLFVQTKIMSQTQINNFRMIKKIGKGSSAKVFLVSQDEFFALKILRMNKITNNDSENENEFKDENDSENVKIENSNFNNIRNLLNEFEIMSQISHPNVIKTFGISYVMKTIHLQYYLIIVQQI